MSKDANVIAKYFTVDTNHTKVLRSAKTNKISKAGNNTKAFSYGETSFTF